MEATSFCNLSSEVTFHDVCLLPFIGSKSLFIAYAQWELIAQMCEYQETEITWNNFKGYLHHFYKLHFRKMNIKVEK